MRGLLARVVLAAAVLVISPVALVGDNPYIDVEDGEVLADADKAATKYCKDAVFLTAEERTDARQALLDGLGGSNFMKEILVSAENQDDLSTKAQEKITVPWMLGQAAPCVVALLMPVLWYCYCWTSCVCCRCCRVCARRHELPKPLKLIFPAAIFVLFCGLCGCVGMGDAAYGNTQQGFDIAACTTGRILNTTLAGQGGEQHFLGLMGIMDKLWTLDKKLDTGSGFLTDLNAVLDSTVKISQATKVSTGTLDLISATLGIPANVEPRDALGTSLMHKNKMGPGLAPVLGQVSSLLDASIATALAQARAEVAKQLGPAARADLQETLRTASEPLLRFKRNVRDTFSFFVDEEQFDQVKSLVDNEMYYGMVGIFLCAFMVMSCSVCGSSLFAGREKVPEEDAKGQQEGLNPFYKTVNRCACCSWQCSFLYCFLAFFLGGMILAVTVPMSGMCLIMDEVDKPLINDISGALGMDMTGDAGDMLLELVDKCVAGKGSVNPNMFDIIFVRENATNASVPGAKVTMRQKLVGTVRDPIFEKFQAIDDTMSNQSITIADQAAILSLRAIFRDNDVRGMIIADASAMSADANLAGLALDNRGDNGIAVGFSSSASCADIPINGTLQGLSGTMPGIDGFVTKLAYYGTRISHSTCAEKVVCPTSPGTNQAACVAGNAYIDVKRKVLSSNTYRCDLFEAPGNPSLYCDPKDMMQVFGIWTSDCLQADGTMKVKRKDCTLSEFAQYMTDHDVRLDKVFRRVDTTVSSTFSSITTDLRDVVDLHLLSVIMAIVDGITCGFLPGFYQNMLDGFCFKGIIGFRQLASSYVGSGAVVFILMLVSYVLWRYHIDNVNAWDEDNIPKCTQVVPIEPTEIQ